MNLKIMNILNLLRDVDLKKDENRIKQILDNTDFVIDGPFIQELRDITLAMRGSSNQRIYQKINDEFVEVNIE